MLAREIRRQRHVGIAQTGAAGSVKSQSPDSRASIRRALAVEAGRTPRRPASSSVQVRDGRRQVEEAAPRPRSRTNTDARCGRCPEPRRRDCDAARLPERSCLRARIDRSTHWRRSSRLPPALVDAATRHEIDDSCRSGPTLLARHRDGDAGLVQINQTVGCDLRDFREGSAPTLGSGPNPALWRRGTFFSRVPQSLQRSLHRRATQTRPTFAQRVVNSNDVQSGCCSTSLMSRLSSSAVTGGVPPPCGRRSRFPVSR